MSGQVKRGGRTASAGPAGFGFILADSSLKPLYVDSHAAQILAYPKSVRKMRSLDAPLHEKIKSMLPSQGLFSKPSFLAEFISGNRRYLCRMFLVDTPAVHPSNPSVVLLLERAPRSSVDLQQLFQMHNLTQREQETVQLLIQGLTGKEIASRMKVSPNTVKAFLRLVMIKMGVSTRSGIMGKIIQAKP
jgi:DNA-binding CsgD family transcriptional regulator